MKIATRTLGLFALVTIASACGPTTSPVRDDDLGSEPNKHAQLNLQMAAEYIRKGDNEIALRRLQKALEYDPRYAAAYSMLGLLYARLGEDSKAQRNFKQSIRLEPNNPNALNNYGQYECSQGRRQEGLDLFERAVANPLNRSPELAFTNAGVCALSFDADLAEKNLRRGLQINPKLPPALFQMSKLSYENQRFLQARGYLQRYLEVAEQDARSLWLGIRIERELGDRDTVASYGLALKAKYPDSEETRLLFKSEE